MPRIISLSNTRKSCAVMTVDVPPILKFPPIKTLLWKVAVESNTLNSPPLGTTKFLIVPIPVTFKFCTVKLVEVITPRVVIPVELMLVKVALVAFNVVNVLIPVELIFLHQH
jgi:hypothetical protein